MSRLCMTSSRGDPGASLSFTLRTKMTLKRQKNEPTAWSWTDEGSGWTSPSQKDLTPQLLESTWAGPRMAEAVPAVLDAIRATTTADMTADTTEAATIAMMTETTTDHTEGDLLHRTTEGLTGLGPGHDPILPVVTERCCPPYRLSKHTQEMFLSGMSDFRIDLLSSVCYCS